MSSVIDFKKKIKNKFLEILFIYFCFCLCVSDFSLRSGHRRHQTNWIFIFAPPDGLLGGGGGITIFFYNHRGIAYYFHKILQKNLLQIFFFLTDFAKVNTKSNQINMNRENVKSFRKSVQIFFYDRISKKILKILIRLMSGIQK